MAVKGIRFAYAGIRVRNLDRSIAFYRGLGFRIHKRGAMEHGGQWVHLRMPGQEQRLELNFYPKGNRFVEPFTPGSELDHLGFMVDDVNLWVRRARKLGAKVKAQFAETREQLAYVGDPDGIWIEFCGPPAAARPSSHPT